LPAIVDDLGSLGAAELQALVTAEQRWLTGAGIRCAGLLAGNGRAWAIADLALAAGRMSGIPLPHHFGTAQIHHVLHSAAITAVLTDAPARICESQTGWSTAGQSPHTGLTLLIRDLPADAGRLLPPGTAKVTFTSGSTADPKGVCLTQDVMDTVALSVARVAITLGIRRHLSLLPLSTLLENIAGLHAAWLAGATCHLPATPASAISAGTLTPATLLGAVDHSQPESLILVPELLRMLVGGATAGWKPPSCARFYAVGGARVGIELLQQAAAIRLPVFEGYGLSECASVVCLNTPGANRPGSVGRPLAHVRLRVDEHGEIHVGGSPMAGYVSGALGPGTEFSTGDLGEVDAEGYVYVRGRMSNLFINSYGRNLSPEWIESELGQEEAISQVIVFGEARPDVVALITPTHGAAGPQAIAESVARANARLPRYARVARYHVVAERFSAANGLLTGNGRPRRQLIRQRYADTIDRLHQETHDVLS
jgi:long-subunit acyl-CoA synthetase (AMP-forming)